MLDSLRNELASFEDAQQRLKTKLKREHDGKRAADARVSELERELKERENQRVELERKQSQLKHRHESALNHEQQRVRDLEQQVCTSFCTLIQVSCGKLTQHSFLLWFQFGSMIDLFLSS